MEMVRNLGDHGVIVSEDVHGKRVEVEYELNILVSTDDTESNNTDTPEPTTTITEITMGGLRFKTINIVSLFPEIRTSKDWNFEKSFRIVQPGVYHDDTVFRARIYNLNGEHIKMPMFSLYVNTGYTSTWTNVYTTAWISPVDEGTDGTVTDMGAISIIPIPGEEGRLYRAVYHPHTPTYSHAKIASKTSIPAFDID